MAEIRINTTGGLKLYDADNSHYAQIVAGTITSNVDAITLGHDTVTIADNLSLGSDSAILKFGADTEIALTHVADTGLKLTDSGGTPTLQLHDANESIASDGSKVIITSGGTAFSLPTSDGSNGQVLTTNGSGVLSFATASSADPSSADGDSLGTASAEWSDLYLADGGIIYFGNDQDVTLTHDPDDGLFLKSIATGDDNPVLLTLQTGETDLAADDVIGKIAFQAPDEGTGTDAILVSAAIQAVAEGDHSSSSNATSLQFMTGASEAAATKMTLSSAGLLTVTGGITMTGTTPTLTIGDAGAEDAKIVFDGNAQDYHIGLDDSLDSFVIGNNGFSTQCIVVNDSAIVTMPNQPCFLGLNDGGDTVNNAADTTIPIDTEAFDLNGDLSSNTFTAPVTGKYFLNGAINLDAGSSSNTRFQNVIVMLTCSNRKLKFGYNTVYTNEDDHMQLSGSGVVDMDANDTCVLQVFASRHGASGATTTVGSSTDLRSGLGGYLVA
jgi:hypothetical protein